MMLVSVFVLSTLVFLRAGVVSATTDTKDVHQRVADNVNVALLRGILDDVIVENNKRQSAVAAGVARSEEQAGCVTSEELLQIVDKVQREVESTINTTIFTEIRTLEERQLQHEINVVPPSAPFNLIVSHTTATSIYFTWEQPSNDRVDYYVLNSTYQGPCTTLEIPTTTTTTIGGAGRKYSLTNLRMNSVYKIELQAVNAGGRSQAVGLTSKTTINLPTAAPSGVPQSLRSVSTTPTSITIEWSEIECLDQNGVITSYDVRVNDRVVLTTSLTQATITGLTPSTRYFIDVRGRNFIGEGPFEDSKLVVTTPSRKGNNVQVMCYTDDTCSQNTTPSSMTLEECCLLSNGLGFKTTNANTCSACIVVGWTQNTLDAPEHGPEYVVKAGFLKGAGKGQKLDLHFTINTELRSASSSDITVHPLSLSIPYEKPITEEVGITFHQDSIAQEGNETAILKLVPLSGSVEDHFDPSIREGVFFEDQLVLNIIDQDYVTFSLTNDDYRATEGDQYMPVKVMRDGFIGTPVTILITPMTLSQHRTTGRPYPHMVPYNDPLSPTEADNNDFDNSGIVVTFEANEDHSQVFDLPAPVSINDDDVNEAYEQDFVITMKVIVAMDPSRVNRTQYESLCRIIDDDPIRIGFEQPQYEFNEPNFFQETITDRVFLVKENGTQTEQTFRVVLTATDHTPLNTNIRPASVSSTSDDGYLQPNDYLLGKPNQRSLLLNFPPESQRISFNFRLFSDNEAEGREAFQVSVVPHELNTHLFLEPMTLSTSTFIIINDNSSP